MTFETRVRAPIDAHFSENNDNITRKESQALLKWYYERQMNKEYKICIILEMISSDPTKKGQVIPKKV